MAYNPPSALSGPAWDAFNDEYERVAPIRYFFWNIIPDICWHPIRHKLERIKHWIRYRTTHRYNKVSTGLSPGYYGISEIMMNVNFNILKDFVEVRLARSAWWASPEYKNRSFACKYMPFYRIFFKFRSSKFGLEHLDWAAKLDDPALPLHHQNPPQAIAAREIRELYMWWTVDRYTLGNTLLKDDEYWEHIHNDIDINTNMLIRLMKIRNELST